MAQKIINQYQEDSSGGFTASFESDEKLRIAAGKAVAKMRRAILRGDQVEPWVSELIERIDIWDDAGPGTTSMVAVGWVLQDRGVLKK